jgi:hypothetical protein
MPFTTRRRVKGAPTKPRTAFKFWQMNNYQNATDQLAINSPEKFTKNGKFRMVDVQRLLPLDYYKSLSDEVRVMYNKQSADDRERYENEMRLFQCQQRLMTIETQSAPAPAPAPAAAPAMVSTKSQKEPTPEEDRVVIAISEDWLTVRAAIARKADRSRAAMVAALAPAPVAPAPVAPAPVALALAPAMVAAPVAPAPAAALAPAPAVDIQVPTESFIERQLAQKDSDTSQTQDPVNITIHHPFMGDLSTSLRIGDCDHILSTGRQAGCSGYSIETIKSALAGWNSDGIRYTKMEFWDPDTIGSRPFIKITENISDFQTLVIAKERKSGIGKAAFLNTKTNRIILRTATRIKNESMMESFKIHETHAPYWLVDTGIFTTDKGFWTRLMKHYIFKVSEI